MGKPNRTALFILVFCCSLLLCCWAGVRPTQAQSIVQPYSTYTIDSTDRPIPVPEAYVLHQMIDGLSLGIGGFAKPADIYVDRQSDHLYIVDSGNNRIVQLGGDGRVLRQFGPELGLRNPQGIYHSSEDGSLWIADTGNARVLQLDANAEVLREFGPPQSEALTELGTAAPTKVLVDKRGYIYLLEGSGVGMIVMDQRNEFRGFFGTTRLGFSTRWLWARYLATGAQREKFLMARPTAHTDMFLADDGFVYTAVAGSSSHQIQKLSPVGVNVFIGRGLEQRLYREKIFGERRRALTGEPPVRFVAVAVDADGTVTALDASNGRIYQYDQQRSLLLAFGRTGRGKGEFGLPSQLEVDSRGRLYVLDPARATVYVLRPTQFAASVHRASALQWEGQYAQAAATWEGVLGIASNYELAHSGIGKSSFQLGYWREAMDEYALARDQVGYSLAFHEYRQGLLRQNVGWLVTCVFVVFGGAWVGTSTVRRRSRQRLSSRARSRRLPGALAILVRPSQTMELLAEGQSLRPVVVLLTLGGLARLVSLALMAFHMRATPSAGSVINWVRLYRPVAAYLMPELRWEEANAFVEVLRVILPWLLWTVANYGVAALFDGEGSFRQVARTTAYCLVPYILFAVPIALMSHLLTGQERGLYETLWSIVFYWVLILLVIEVAVVHKYSAARTVGVGVVMSFGLMILGGAIVLVVLLVQKAAGFVWEVIYETLRIVF